MIDKIGRYDFLAEPFHSDATRHLLMICLGNDMLNAADYHATDRGFGMDYLNPLHRTWVLSRLAVEMVEMPVAYAEFRIETWVESVMKYFTFRNFRILDKFDETKVYGYARSIWAMIDTRERTMQSILDVRNGAICDYVSPETPCPIDKPSNIRIKTQPELIKSLPTVYNDIDVNGHVNSVKYIEHVFNLFPLSWHEEHKIRRFDIAYVAETYFGDTLHFHQEKVNDREFNLRLMKTSGEGDDEVEVSRCHLVFD